MIDELIQIVLRQAMIYFHLDQFLSRSELDQALTRCNVPQPVAKNSVGCSLMRVRPRDKSFLIYKYKASPFRHEVFVVDFFRRTKPVRQPV